ncbi:MAG: endonuclease/exonuclease/phosphatase family protein [Bacteroidales bacterium]|nr:endonuclease/exonuclease/phosphatase family protein [Bacteroidales bacterium]
MKLKNITAFCLLGLFLSLLAVSCTQQEGGEDEYITITAAFPDKVESKVSVAEKDDDSGLILSWEETDKIVVIGESTETFSLSSIDGNIATFKGKKVQGEVFDVILSNCEDFEQRSYLHQVQTGVSSTESLEYDACLKGVDTYQDVKFTEDWATGHGGSLLQSGCLLLYFQLPVAAETVTAVTLKTSAPVFYATNSESALKSSIMEMEIENGKVAKENTVKAYFMTSVLETEIRNGVSFRLTVVTDNGTYYKDFTPGNVKIKPGKRNVIKLNSKNWQPLLEYKTYTFMTYNVGKFIKFENELGRRSYQDVASVINHYEADIVGLNEITSYQVTHNIIKDELAGKIGAGWNYYSAIADEVTSGKGIVYSPNIHIISNTKIDLKCDDGNRSLGVFESDDFVFCVTHLDHHLETNRKEQIATINKWISDNYGSSEKPIILVGDMNAKPTDREIQSYLASNWQTISDTNTYTFVNSNGEKKCLDYIFLWKNDAVEYKVNKTEVIHTCPGVNVDLASDHYPVYAEIAFAKRYEVEELKEHIQTGLDRLSDTYIYEEKF